MQRRYNLAHLILASVMVLLLIAVVDAQARIAFMSDREWNWEIYVMDADGSNQQNLSNNDSDEWDPSWSPDGERILFVSTADIYVMDADGGNPKNLTGGRRDNEFSPAWSPDGKRIVFACLGADGHTEICVMDADGNNQRRLTNNRLHDKSPSWSSDGKRIVFSSYRDGNAEIYVMDNDGGNQQKLTNNPHLDGGPAWFGPAFAVTPTGKKFTRWGWLKQVDR